MAFLKFLDKLLQAPKASEKQVVKKQHYFDEPAGYYTLRGEGLDSAYSAWLKTKKLATDQLQAIGSHALAANLDNRSGYVREFCLRALMLIDGVEALKAVIQRLNDYVPSNRQLALQLTLKWLAELPLATLIDALPELDSLQEKSRTNHAAVYEVLVQRVAADDGREALVAGLGSHRAAVRRACWKRCMQTLTWTGTERIQFAMRCGDPAIARSVEKDVFDLPDSELIEWFSKLNQVRAMPLRRAFLVAVRRKTLVDSQKLISFALWDNSYSIRWLARHWSKDTPDNLLQLYTSALLGDAASRRKRYALEGLAELKLPEGLQACKVALLDPNPVIRRAALSTACVIDTANQSTYVERALQDADMFVVREAFKQIVGLGLPLPIDAIVATAKARREELAFFELMLRYASDLPIWQALHLATFTSLVAPNIKLELTTKVEEFLSGLPVTQVYVAPNKQQWQAIIAWMPMHTLGPQSGLRFAMEIYAKQMGA